MLIILHSKIFMKLSIICFTLLLLVSYKVALSLGQFFEAITIANRLTWLLRLAILTFFLIRVHPYTLQLKKVMLTLCNALLTKELTSTSVILMG